MLVNDKKGRYWILWTVLAFAVFFLIAIPFILLISSDQISTTSENTAKVAKINVRGPISSSGSNSAFQQTGASANQIVDFIEKANQRSDIDAIMLDINSPGGSAVATDRIANKIKRVNKTSVSLIRDVGASGAYWIASSTDTIIANRMSIVGSIGVISSYLEFSELLNKYGVEYQRLVAGEYKDAGSPYKNLTNDEERLLESKLDKTHDFFIKAIAENRGLSEGKARRLGDGSFYLGSEGLDNGLVDKLGNEQKVNEHLKERLNVSKVSFTVYEEKPSLIDSLANVLNHNSFFIGKGIGSTLKGNSNQPEIMLK